MKVIFIDMDNTIAENKTCDDVVFTQGLYLDKRPIQIVIDAITMLYPEITKVIISKAQGGNEGVREKLQWLQSYFTNVDDFIFLNENDKYYMKAVLADQWVTKHGIDTSEALILDDSKQVLQYCKAYGFQTMYPQQIICDYEQYIKQVNHCK